MKTIAYWALHYGAEYLPWSIRSVQDAVDELHVLYSDRPSFGYQSNIACPESEADLLSAAQKFRNPSKPLHWHRGRWATEGAQRDEIFGIAKAAGADLVVVVDADELWDPETLKMQIRAAREASERDTLMPFVHFWRSFSHVCSDPSRPVRIVKPAGHGIRYADQPIPVLHFGYAQSEAITRYKIAIHGHRGEWREDWLDGKFLSWTAGQMTKDVHPTCGWNSSFGDFFWNVRNTDLTLLPVLSRLLGDHPYISMEIIR